MIYLDNASTTKVCDSAASEMLRCMQENYGNASSTHILGLEAERIINNTRSKVANVLKVSRDDVYFTSGGTESNNIAILGTARAAYRKGRIITTKVEHKSILNAFERLEKDGFEVVYLPVDSNGTVDINMLKRAINSNTILVSTIYVNNEVGTINPIEEIYKTVKSINPKIYVHTDAVQGFGKIDIPKNSADLISVSGHKIHGPKGVGALYVKSGVKIMPIVFGGGQEKGLRSGTENVPAIAGFGASIDALEPKKYYEIQEINRYMRKLLTEKIEGIRINSPIQGSPYILNISVEGTKSEILLHYLENEKIYVSNGSACHSNHPMPSHVLRAMGLDRKLVECSLRISFGLFNNISEVEPAVEKFESVIAQIRKAMKY